MVGKRCLLMVLCSWFVTGCAPLVFFGAGTAAGVAGYQYYQGELNVVYEAPFIETWDAALRALDNLEMTVVKKTHDLTSGKITAKEKNDTAVTIGFEYRTAQQTEVDIRVGLLGDKRGSMVLKEEIRKELMKG